MHPAYSVIIFTTLSGAGFGLMAVLGYKVAFGEIARHWHVGFFGLAVAFLLTGIGLVSSTMHLGRPERAWRAFSQWRSSWLSREGVAAVVTLAVAGLLGLVWTFAPGPGFLIVLLGLTTAGLALVTVYTTGMIYQSLPTIRAWHQPIVAPIYILLALMSGAVIAHTLLLATAQGDATVGRFAILLLLLGAVAKIHYWRPIDAASPFSNSGTATGLGYLGTVRILEQPHTQANFVQREMGYAIARRHSEKLRRSALLMSFALPALLVLLSLASNGLPALAAAIGAVLSMMAGLFVERWLFFAEAEHVVTTFYGRG